MQKVNSKSATDKQNILFIINGPINDQGKITVSGGDIRLFEIVKHLAGFNQQILTTTNGVKLLKQFHVSVKKTHLIKYTVKNGIISHLLLTLLSLFVLPGSLNGYKGIVYSSCEHLYDVLPALRLKIFNRCSWYAVQHNVYDLPWREVRGNTPWLRRYIYWLNRHFSELLIKYFADKILAVGENTAKKLINNHHDKSTKIKTVACGVDLKSIQKICQKYQTEKGLSYHAVFLGRLDHAKGVIDLIKIWNKVCYSFPAAKLLIIGAGSASFTDQIKQLIKEYKLENNIHLQGAVYDIEQKYRLLNSARIFVFPTYQENWGIVIGEAMAVGLPVLVYDLPKIRPIWKNNVIWVKNGNLSDFSSKIINILRDPKLSARKIKQGKDFIQKFDWEKIAKNELL